MPFQRQTDKLYYRDFYRTQVATRIAKVGSEFIELEATVAYPEGGGQEPDTGVIEIEDGCRLRFLGAQRMYGTPCSIPGLSDVSVGGIIWHQIVPDDLHLLPPLVSGMQAKVRIDVERRAWLSLSHSASHLVYLAVGIHRPDALAGTIGCHIKVDGARFDFAVEQRFTAEDLMAIEETANGFIARDAAITVSQYPHAPDARLWHCEGHTIPCGGTHIDHTGMIGPLKIQRRRLGRGKERIACFFTQATLDLSRYHDGPAS